MDWLTDVLKQYDTTQVTIAALGGHVGLDVCAGAKKLGFKTLIIARKDRSRPYVSHVKTTDGVGCVDECLLVDAFSDIIRPEIQAQLRAKNVIMAHSRYFWVYFDFAQLERDFHVPFFGTRELIRLEERDQSPNQYDVLKTAGIRIPKIFDSHTDIDRLTLTKIHNAVRTYERENFVAATPAEWERIAEEKIAAGAINRDDLKDAVIEEFILGAQVNFNFFYSVVHDRLELMGTDMRRQTSLDGWLRLPAKEQLLVPGAPHHIETGHVAVTVKESLLDKAYEAGERFVAACKHYHPRGIIGPFALQGAIVTDGSREELVVFDVSMRSPGSPGIAATPYSEYLFGRPVSMGERSAMEIRDAISQGMLGKILT